MILHCITDHRLGKSGEILVGQKEPQVHEDSKKLFEGGQHGWNAYLTSEGPMRAVMVHASEGLSLWETAMLIARPHV